MNIWRMEAGGGTRISITFTFTLIFIIQSNIIGNNAIEISGVGTATIILNAQNPLPALCPNNYCIYLLHFSHNYYNLENCNPI